MGTYEQQVRKISIDELSDILKSKKDVVLVDARPRDMYDQKHLPGAISIPLEDIKEYANKFDKNAKIVTYCGGYSCPASTEAAKEFGKLGFKNVRDYKGGIEEWTQKGYPTESS